ncbi:MAG: DNA cytosine methyltransferase [Limnobacter sp.]|uniref:DNA cytosine methyltransferase n=1 Tax=Limnobacter sp. TaxID=2003368 RepID=UPI0030032B6E
MKKPIPIIDLFAGPGGLGEGFSALTKGDLPAFEIKVSIEKDINAHKTLTLRSVYRYLKSMGNLDNYYEYIRGDINETEFRQRPHVAEAFEHVANEALRMELGKSSEQEIDKRIKDALKGSSEWVLIGGPPCQAYSLAGRSRRSREEKQSFESDEKHFLYKEYLRIIRSHSPSVFVMENVKGILSSKISGQPIFRQILDDLSNPSDSQKYLIKSLVVEGDIDTLKGKDYIIHSEDFGIPQCRHRVILLGIRKDIFDSNKRLSKSQKDFLLTPSDRPNNVDDAISDLPILRSGLSKEADSHKSWCLALKQTPSLLGTSRTSPIPEIKSEMNKTFEVIGTNISIGSQFIPGNLPKTSMLPAYKNWVEDVQIGGTVQHCTRKHIREDIQRYFYLSVYAKLISGYVPKIQDLPRSLMPNHKNVTQEKPPNQDRFRVQQAGQPGKTVTSHISKDGHYFIHYDPAQARSFTLREAARIQTFPDNYFFEGGATAGLHQVGNAVPPLLAKQIAKIVSHILGD